MGSQRPNLYGLLGISADASVVEIRAAFRREAKAAHPDAGGDPERFRLLREAHDTLVDPDTRGAYDRKMGIVRVAPGSAGPEMGAWSGQRGDFTGDVEFPAWLRDVTDAPWGAASTSGQAASVRPEHGEDDAVVLTEAVRRWWWPHRATQQPVVIGERCLLCSADAVACCDTRDGRELWRVNLGRAVLYPPVVAGHRVAVVSSDGVMHGLELATGMTVWERPLGADPVGGLATVGEVFVAGALRRLVGVRAVDGERVWATKLAGDPTGVTATPDSVMVSTAGETLHCVEVAKGRSVWWLRSQMVAPVPPVAVGPSLWVATGSGELLRIERGTGAALVSVRAGATVSGMVTDGKVLVATVAGPAGVLALPPSGEPRWSRELPAVTEAPALESGRIHLVDNDGALRSFSLLDGHELLRAPIPFVAAGAPVAAPGSVLVADTDGSVWALAIPEAAV